MYGIKHNEETATKVVILAAGKGARLKNRRQYVTKPLVRLLGLSLIQRAILSSIEAGFRDFVVVVGYKKEILIPYLKQLSKEYGVTIDIAENPDWEKGNGTSVFASRNYVKGRPFFLIMCDHLFDPSILRNLSMDARMGNGIVLAVDSRIGEVFDLEDATKVRLEENSLKAIGKTLDSFNGIDTGMFYCTPDIFDALSRAFERGRYTLSDGISAAIESSRVRTHDIGSRFWLDVDTEESFKYAHEALLAGLSKPEDGYVARYLNRPVSRRITACLLQTPLTPNMVSIISFAIAALGAFLFSFGNYSYTLIAGLLVQLSSVVDGCDGEVARLKFQGTPFGGWFDTILDRYADTAIVVGITYGYWMDHPGILPWLGGIVAMTGFILASYAKKEFALRYSKGLPGGIDEKLIKRDLRLFVLFLGAMVNQPFPAMVIIGLASHIITAWIFATVYLGIRR